jgi:hypothetical protein
MTMNEKEKTISQAIALRELEVAFAAERINDGCTTAELFEYLETIREPGENLDDLRRLVMIRWLSDVAAA